MEGLLGTRAGLQADLNLIFQVVGNSTALLRTLKVGDSIQDIIGPLGRPTHVENLGTVICVGGGTGVAVMYPITKAYKEAGNNVIAIIGSRTKDLLILEDEMKAASHDLRVTTDDGTYGVHGFVTDVLRQILDERKDASDLLYCKLNPFVSGSVKIVTPPIKKKADVSARALPMPCTSARAPIVKGASALNARPTL
jgi:ferredoxin--NADP+ reductase